MQRLAAKIMNQATFLRTKTVRTWHICAALEDAGITPAHWTAHDVVTAMYATVAGWAAPEQLNNPLAYFRFLLGRITPEQVAGHVASKEKAAQDRAARLASAHAAAARAAAPAPIQTAPRVSWRERFAAEYETARTTKATA
ncbi:hypothetical protein ACIQTZ_22935 [Paenarthrobacter sp. NPDC090520]|uniref:hypothetical protein n=1 Tax=Paenarthrobacter sp. NPDC090520 TaxID=3364382 RepID=UPI003813681B